MATKYNNISTNDLKIIQNFAYLCDLHFAFTKYRKTKTITAGDQSNKSYITNYSACRRRGQRSLKMPPFLFFFSFSVSKVGLPLMGYTAVQYTDCYSEPMSTRVLNSISSRICRENTQFNMYTTTSKQQEGCTFKDSHPKCFFDTAKLSPGAVNRGDVLTACFRDIQSQFEWRL